MGSNLVIFFLAVLVVLLLIKLMIWLRGHSYHFDIVIDPEDRDD